MKRNFYAPLLALCVAVALATVAGAQTKRKGTAPAPAPQGPMTGGGLRTNVPLPTSDMVVTVNLRRLLNEGIPRALSNDAAQVAQVNADIDLFKARTGIDARQFDALTVGALLTNPSASVTKLDRIVAVARGTFDPAALVSAGRIAAKGQYRQQQYGGKDIYVFTLNDQLKLFGLVKMKVTDLALSVLDTNTLALGEPEGVRAAIDAAAGRNRADQELLNMAGGPASLIGFAGNVPAAAVADLDLGSPEISRSLASIRRFYGSIGMTGTGFEMLTVLRTLSAADAKSLSDTVQALRQLAPAFINMSSARGRLAKNAADSLKVTTQGPEVQLRLELSPTDIATLRTVF